ncbi:hypothetical protein M422DRAFT_255164 [Sphaerobolus stellatus SS14]|uniref:Uncharacterized protein n=1 Tax=Sphaerobolus stellatus (strain SS14) TaxID=990650 RepID=A0A0C9V4P4_SPHS4|nr:hypothetical protein M422DRAFT_255164 [Sphaerobolus stellatus SS14]
MPEDSPEIGGIIDDILVPSNPLPNPSILQMRGTKKSEQVFNSFHKRAGEALLAITTFPTDLKLSVLHVGGNLGLFPRLRAVEFLQRYVHNVDKDPMRLSQVDSLLQQYDATLAQEKWWRWAIMSFAQSKHTHSGLLYKAWLLWMETVMQGNWFYMQWRNDLCPKIIDDISHIALRCVRPIQTDDFRVPYADNTWKNDEITDGMQAWNKEMTEAQFKIGCVLKRFLWVYGLYMIAGPGGAFAAKWCKQTVEDTACWLVQCS